MAVKALRSWGRYRDLPSDVKEHFGSRISLLDWYDHEAYWKLLRHFVSVLEERRSEVPDLRMDEDLWEYLGRSWASGYFCGSPFDPTGSSPERTLDVFYSFWSLRYDTGTPRLEIQGPGRAEIELPDSAIVEPEWCRMIQSAVATVLRQSHARSVVVSELSCRARGDRVCRWRMSWEEALEPVHAG